MLFPSKTVQKPPPISKPKPRYPPYIPKGNTIGVPFKISTSTAEPGAYPKQVEGPEPIKSVDVGN